MSAPCNPQLSAEYVRSLLSYNKKTGELRWKVNRKPRGKKGQIAGCQRRDGYWIIGIDGAIYLGHRIAWLIVTGAFPTEQIDHKHGHTHSLKWKELRAATNAQNCRNHGVQKNNKSGIKGVYKRKDCNRWAAFIRVDYENMYLGLFKTSKEAADAYKAAAKKFHREFAHF